MSVLLERLRGGLIVSCQAQPGSALDDPSIIAALARVAEAGGAVAVRIQGLENIKAVRSRIDIPVIGLLKRTYEGYEPYITATPDSAQAVAEAGAHIVAFDATSRQRPVRSTLASIVETVTAAGAVPMADCAQLEDGRAARALGVEVIATTLRGYTKETQGSALPALDLVRELRTVGGFVICEGGIHTPEQAQEAMHAGADALVVGTAITNVDWLVSRFVHALKGRT